MLIKVSTGLPTYVVRQKRSHWSCARKNPAVDAEAVGQLDLYVTGEWRRERTIFNDLVHSAQRHKLEWKALFPAGVKDEKGLKAIDKKMAIKQSPIWRNTLSDPVICTGGFDSVRQEFGSGRRKEKQLNRQVVELKSQKYPTRALIQP